MNIETENGKNESLVANFDEFIRNWEKHIKLSDEKKRKKRQGIIDAQKAENQNMDGTLDLGDFAPP